MRGMRETALLAVLSAAMAWLWPCPAGAADTIPMGLSAKSAEPYSSCQVGCPVRLPEALHSTQLAAFRR